MVCLWNQGVLSFLFVPLSCGFPFLQWCAFIFSSHRRSSAGDVPLSGAEPRRLRLKS